MTVTQDELWHWALSPSSSSKTEKLYLQPDAVRLSVTSVSILKDMCFSRAKVSQVWGQPTTISSLIPYVFDPGAGKEKERMKKRREFCVKECGTKQRICEPGWNCKIRFSWKCEVLFSSACLKAEKNQTEA